MEYNRHENDGGESQSEILRRGGSHESFDRPVATLDFPAVALLRELAAPPDSHEHRVLPVTVAFSVLSCGRLPSGRVWADDHLAAPVNGDLPISDGERHG
jgi:hypothetical protein